jgi:hypothetical protein
MTQRIDTPAEWVITTFGGVVDGLKAGTISSTHPPIAPKTNPDAQVDIGILQRMDLVQPNKMLGGQLGWPEAWIPEPNRRLFFIIDLRNRKRPCAVFVICDPERQAHQLFALKRMKGRFGRQEYQFICPNTGRQSTTVSYSNGRFFLLELTFNISRAIVPPILKAEGIGVIEQQDCSKLGWTSAAKRALVLMPEAP